VIFRMEIDLKRSHRLRMNYVMTNLTVVRNSGCISKRYNMVGILVSVVNIMLRTGLFNCVIINLYLLLSVP
jgi:hypothetical protein